MTDIQRAPTVDWRPLATNVGLLALLWLAYSSVRSLTGDAAELARENGQRLWQIQSDLGIALEPAVQQLIPGPIGHQLANVYYLVHFPVTITVLFVALALDRNGAFRRFRNGLIGVTGAALVIHLLWPLAPPRMLPDVIDSGAVYGPNPYSFPGSDGANQFAAMPSMHVAWAVLVAAALWQLSSRPALRAAALFHAAVTTVVVVVTGHHYLADVVAGAALAVVAIAAQRWFDRSGHQYHDQRRGNRTTSRSTVRLPEVSMPMTRSLSRGPKT